MTTLSDNAKIREIHANPVLHRAWVTLGREAKQIILHAMNIGTDQRWMEGVIQDALDRDQLNNRLITARCDCCSAVVTATEPVLKAQGWLLHPEHQICGAHD